MYSFLVIQLFATATLYFKRAITFVALILLVVAFLTANMFHWGFTRARISLT